MRLGFPVVAAATAVAAVFVLAQAVQGVDGSDEPRIGPTIVLPVTSDADAAPARPQSRPETEQRRSLGSAPEPRTERTPPRTTGGAVDADPAAPVENRPVPFRTPKTPPVATPPDLGSAPEPDAPERVPVPVCRVDDDSPRERWMKRWNRDGDDRDGQDGDDRDRDRGGNDRPGGDHDWDGDHNQAGCRD